MPAPHILLAVDIGGTFTDIVALDLRTGKIAVEKLLTSTPDPSHAVLAGIRKLLESAQYPPAAIRYVVHGTTLITNTLIERKGAKTALIATAGFRDAIEIGIEGRYDMYDLALKNRHPWQNGTYALICPSACWPTGASTCPSIANTCAKSVPSCAPKRSKRSPSASSTPTPTRRTNLPRWTSCGKPCQISRYQSRIKSRPA